MNEELDSQLSAMFDNELPAAECELLARRLSRDEALQGALGRYAVIGAAIRARARARALDTNLAARVTQRGRGRAGAVRRTRSRAPSRQSLRGLPLVATGCRRRGRRRGSGRVGFLVALAGAARPETRGRQQDARRGKRRRARHQRTRPLRGTRHVSNRAPLCRPRSWPTTWSRTANTPHRSAAATCCPRWSRVNAGTAQASDESEEAIAADKAPDPHAQDPQ